MPWAAEHHTGPDHGRSGTKTFLRAPVHANGQPRTTNTATKHTTNTRDGEETRKEERETYTCGDNVAECDILEAVVLPNVVIVRDVAATSPTSVPQQNTEETERERKKEHREKDTHMPAGRPEDAKVSTSSEVKSGLLNLSCAQQPAMSV
jgi:hypothetical protein